MTARAISGDSTRHMQDVISRDGCYWSGAIGHVVFAMRVRHEAGQRAVLCSSTPGIVRPPALCYCVRQLHRSILRRTSRQTDLYVSWRIQQLPKLVNNNIFFFFIRSLTQRNDINICHSQQAATQDSEKYIHM